jgi:hypothetical protein
MLLLVGCADGRPYPADVAKEFETGYPGLKVIAVEITEDEVAARSFRVTYRFRENLPTHDLEIQYMPGPGGVWGANPVETSQLPHP